MYVYVIGRGVDYVSGPFNVTITAGRTLAVFNVPIYNDNIVEHNESFNLSINPFSLPNIVTAVDSVQIIVTIIDDDSKFKFAYNVYVLM